MKTRHLIFSMLILFVGHQSTFAQTGFSVGGSAAYLYSYRTLKDLPASTQELRDEIEDPVLAMSFSVEGMYLFKNNLAISTGLCYSNIGYKSEYDDLQLGDQIGPYGFVSGSSGLDELTIRSRLLQVSIPLMAGYKLALGESNKHALLLRLGINNHFIVATRNTAALTYENDSKKIEKSDGPDVNPYSLSACVNIGYYYTVDRHNIGLTVMGDYNLTPVTPNISSGTGKEFYYFGGFGLSYLYSIHK